MTQIGIKLLIKKPSVSFANRLNMNESWILRINPIIKNKEVIGQQKETKGIMVN